MPKHDMSKKPLKQLKYETISTLINNEVITKFSDILDNRYVPVSSLAKDLGIHYNKLSPAVEHFNTHNFRISHVLKMSEMFNVSPQKIFELIIADHHD